MDVIKTIDLLVDVDKLEESLFEIYKELRPNAEKSKTTIKELKGGFINLSYVLYSENDIQNAIVFRTYGQKINDKEISKMKEELKAQNSTVEQDFDFKKNFFDRTNEAFIMHSISKYNLCESVFGKYINGMCFGYAQGVTSSGPLMLTNDYLEEMSTKLAKLHSLKIELPENSFKTHHDKLIQKFGPSIQPLIGVVYQEIEKIKEFPYNEYPKIIEVITEEQIYMSKLEKIGLGEIAFCHNDLNQKNIIWNPQERNLKFIDFEMCMNNYIACELGYFFYYFSGHFLNDFIEELLPNDNYCLKFIRRYLEKKFELRNEKIDKETFEDEVKKLFIRTNVFLLSQMSKMIMMSPLFDFKPDFFNSDEASQERSKIPYFCGRYGLKIFKAYANRKDKILKSLDDYLEKQ